MISLRLYGDALGDSIGGDQRVQTGTRADVAGDSGDPDFRSFAVRLSEGQPDAASQLLARFSAQLLGLARRRLGTRLAAKSAPEDVLQSVLRTFFRRLGEGDVELRDWSALSGLLSVLTLRKCREQARRYGAARRDVRRETRLPCSGEGLDGSDEVTVPDRGPTPDEVAVYSDLLSRLLDSAEPRDRRILELVLAGESGVAVARIVGCSERTVYRTLRRVQDWLIESGDVGPSF